MKKFIFSLSKRECNDSCSPTTYYPHWKCIEDNFQTFIIEAYADNEEKITELWPKAYQVDTISDNIPSIPTEYLELKEQMRAIEKRMWQIRKEFGETMPFKVGDTIECEEGTGIIYQIDVKKDIYQIDVMFNPFKQDGKPSVRKKIYKLVLYPSLYSRSVRGVKINGKNLSTYAEDSI